MCTTPSTTPSCLAFAKPLHREGQQLQGGAFKKEATRPSPPPPAPTELRLSPGIVDTIPVGWTRNSTNDAIKKENDARRRRRRRPRRSRGKAFAPELDPSAKRGEQQAKPDILVADHHLRIRHRAPEPHRGTPPLDGVPRTFFHGLGPLPQLPRPAPRRQQHHAPADRASRPRPAWPRSSPGRPAQPAAGCWRPRTAPLPSAARRPAPRRPAPCLQAPRRQAPRRRALHPRRACVVVHGWGKAEKRPRHHHPWSRTALPSLPPAGAARWTAAEPLRRRQLGFPPCRQARATRGSALSTQAFFNFFVLFGSLMCGTPM